MDSSTSAPARAPARPPASSRRAACRPADPPVGRASAPFSLSPGPIPFRRWSPAAWSGPRSPCSWWRRSARSSSPSRSRPRCPWCSDSRAQPRDISPNADRVRDGSPGRLRPVRAGRGVVLRDRRRRRGGAPTGGRARAWRATPSIASHGTDATTTAAWCPTASTGCGWRGARRAAASTPSRRCGWTPVRRASGSRRVAPNVLAPGVPGGARRVRVSYSGPRNLNPEFRVFRTDVSPPQVVRLFRGDRSRSGVWDGSVRGGGHGARRQLRVLRAGARPGGQPDARARAGPADRDAAAPRTGVAVRRLTLQGPSEPVSAGALATLRVGPRAATIRVRVLQAGLAQERSAATAAAAGGSGSGSRATPTRASIWCGSAPAAGGRCGRWPWRAGPPPRGPRRRPRPILVLPAVTWQGLNRWDSDLDGFADTLSDARSIPAERPFREGAPAAAVRLRGLAAAALPRPRAAGL